MPFASKNYHAGRWAYRLIATTAILFILVLALFSLFLFFLPHVVSTSWCQGLIRETASDTIGRPMQIESINWSWSEGLNIEHLVIPDLPEFSEKPLISIEKLRFKPDIRKIIRREAEFSVFVSTVAINLVSNPKGFKNIEKLLVGGETPPGPPALKMKPEKKVEDKSVRFPSFLKDIAFHFQLENFNLHYEDKALEETYEVDNLALELEIPSIKKESLDFKLMTDIWINGQQIPRSVVTASLKNLFADDDSLNLESLIAEADINLPGFSAKMNANMADSKANFHLDLDSAMEAIGPFIPKPYLGTSLHGDLDGKLSAETDLSKFLDAPLAFSLSIQGEGLAISGKMVNENTIGPGDVALTFSGKLDIPGAAIELTQGDIYFLEKGEFQIKAMVEEFKSDDRTVRLSISNLIFDLYEIFSLLRPLLPPAVALVETPKKEAFFSLDNLTVQGQPTGGPLDVRINDLKLQIPEAAYAEEKSDGPSLHLTDSRFAVEALTIRLSDLFPESFNLIFSLGLGHLEGVRGTDTFSISDIRLKRFQAFANEISNAENAAFGIKGKVHFDQQLTINHGKFAEMIKFDGLHHLLKGEINLSTEKPASISLEALELVGESLVFDARDFGPLQSRMEISSNSCEISVNALDPLNVHIRKVKIDANLEKAVAASFSAEILHFPDPRIDFKMDLATNIKALLEKLPPNLLAGNSGEGNLNVSLSLMGRPPNRNETEAIEKLLFAGNLAFIDHLNLDVRIVNGSVKLPLSGEARLEIHSLDASPVITYTFDGNTGQGAFSSTVSAKGSAFTSSTMASSDVSALFSVSADHDYLKRIDLLPSFSLSPTDTNASANISIEGLDRILSPSNLPGLTDLFTSLGVEVTAVFDIPEPAGINELGIRGLPPIDTDGPMAANIRFQLQPDRFIAGSLSIKTNAMNFFMPERVNIDQIDTNLTLSKYLTILRSDRNLLVENEPELSTTVMALDGPVKSVYSNNPIQRHIRRIQERMSPDPTLSFKQADVLAAPFPLSIEDSVFMLNFDKGLPNLDFFQAHLLDGTLNGSLSMDTSQSNKGQHYTVNTAIYFSGIDTAKLFPDAFSETERETDITGMLHANIPVSDRMRSLLENSNMSIEFTKIGALALERLLYAIDPYENNEAIVSQRQLLKTGTPKNFKMDVKDGFLTLSGIVSVKGIDIAMPTIRRLNIAQIPGMNQFEENLSGLKPLIDLVQLVSATKMILNKKEKTISFE